MRRRTWIWIGLVVVVIAAAIAAIALIHGPKVSETTARERIAELTTALSDALTSDAPAGDPENPALTPDLVAVTATGRTALIDVMTRLRAGTPEGTDPNLAGYTVDAVTVRGSDAVELHGNADGTTSAITNITITRHLVEDDVDWGQAVTCELILENGSGRLTGLVIGHLAEQVVDRR